MSDGFPTDDVSLSMLEMACTPDEEGQSRLIDFLTFGSEELEPIDYFDPESGQVVHIPVSAGGYTTTGVILSLIAEIRTLRENGRSTDV